MERKEHIKQFWKKYWAVVWLVAAIFCAVSLMAYAEFDTNKNRVKRVAANVSSGGQMFSSDYLDKSMTIQKVPFSSGTNGYCSVPVKIWNYSSSNPTKAYHEVLPYTLTATIVKRVTVEGANGDPDTIEYQTIAQNELGTLDIRYDDNIDNSDYGSSFTWNADESAYVITNDYSFTADADENYVPTAHEYVIRFPESMLTNNDNIFVKLEATPTNSDINLFPISGIVGIQTTGAALTQGWTGYFSDNTSYTDYNGFNYVFSGNGSETIVFQWCTDYLEVSQVSLDTYGFTATTSSAPENGVPGAWKQVTINADANTLNRYDFQLYMTGDPSRDYGDRSLSYEESGSFWKTVESYVHDNLPKQ